MLKPDNFTKLNEAKLNISVSTMSTMPCGLHKAPLDEAQYLMPEICELKLPRKLMGSSLENWLIDVKIHMLMKGQYPCIPNWHCDNVPRVNGELKYDFANAEQDMFLWISGEPRTEYFHDSHYSFIHTIKSHDEWGHLAEHADIRKVEPQTWYSFSQLSPHRGTIATKSGWRMFVRIMPKPEDWKPKENYIRRHAQVYLDASTFTW